MPGWLTAAIVVTGLIVFFCWRRDQKTAQAEAAEEALERERIKREFGS